MNLIEFLPTRLISFYCEGFDTKKIGSSIKRLRKVVL